MYTKIIKLILVCFKKLGAIILGIHGSLLINSGASVTLIEKYLGHTKIEEHYIHIHICLVLPLTLLYLLLIT